MAHCCHLVANSSLDELEPHISKTHIHKKESFRIKKCSDDLNDVTAMVRRHETQKGMNGTTWGDARDKLAVVLKLMLEWRVLPHKPNKEKMTKTFDWAIVITVLKCQTRPRRQPINTLEILASYASTFLHRWIPFDQTLCFNNASVWSYPMITGIPQSPDPCYR